MLQFSVTALFYLDNSRKIHLRGMRARQPKDAKRRAPHHVGERERAYARMGETERGPFGSSFYVSSVWCNKDYRGISQFQIYITRMAQVSPCSEIRRFISCLFWSIIPAKLCWLFRAILRNLVPRNQIWGVFIRMALICSLE